MKDRQTKGYSLLDIAMKHSKGKDQKRLMIHLADQMVKGTDVEKEHTKDRRIAKKIALDHLYEDPNYYTKLKKIETNEMTDSGSSGSFSAPLGGNVIKRKIGTIHNSKKYNVNESLVIGDLVGKRYKYSYGSGSESNIEPNEISWVLGRLREIMKHYLFDWEFYYNFLYEKEDRKQYWGGFQNMMDVLFSDKNVDKTLKTYFLLDKNKGIVTWSKNNKQNKEITKKIFNSKFIEPQTKSNYEEYLKKIEENEQYYRDLHNGQHNEQEFTEATTTSSSGQYDVPFGSGGKNPLKIDGVKSIKSSRAVKDKNFPKWGGPDSVFIKVKEKCKKFPYCNQGIGAIEVLEMNELNEAIKETSRSHGIGEKELKKLVLNEIKKIFI